MKDIHACMHSYPITIYLPLHLSHVEASHFGCVHICACKHQYLFMFVLPCPHTLNMCVNIYRHMQPSFPQCAGMIMLHHIATILHAHMCLLTHFKYLQHICMFMPIDTQSILSADTSTSANSNLLNIQYAQKHRFLVAQLSLLPYTCTKYPKSMDTFI